MKLSNPFRNAKNPPVGDSKSTNPKDAVGSDKMPLHLWPETASVMGTLGLLDGMLKYGRANWRASGVRASIYYDAARRHINKWFEGQDIDPDSGLPHICHALACLAIIADADAAGMLNDDRQYPGGYAELIDRMTPEVARLKAKYADRHPHHYTIGDSIERAQNIAADFRASVDWANEYESMARYQQFTDLTDGSGLEGLRAALAAEGITLRPVVPGGEALDAEPGSPVPGGAGLHDAPVEGPFEAEAPEGMVDRAYETDGRVDSYASDDEPAPTDPGRSAVDAPVELADQPVWPPIDSGDGGDGSDAGGPEPGSGDGSDPQEPDGSSEPAEGPNAGGLECWCDMAPKPHPYHLARQIMNDAGDNLVLHYYVVREDGLTEEV